MLNRQSHPRRQRGAALVTGLLIMMVMTLIGLAAMQSSIIQSNLATNAQLNTIGYQTAEAVLTSATSYTYLSKSLDKPTGTATSIPTGTQDIALETVTNGNNANGGGGGGGKVAVDTSGQVTYCGSLPAVLASGLSLDADQSVNNNTYSRYVFDLTANAEVKKNGKVQAHVQHSQRSTRLMLSQQGKMSLCNI